MAGPSDRDPLLDPPAGTPAWLPTVDQRHRLRWFVWFVGAVLFIGVGACVVRNADTPDDPVLEASTTSTTAPSPLATLFGTVGATLRTAQGAVLELCLLSAETPDERARGLMEVTDLEGYDGMLFSFDADSTGSFYMFNTPTPLLISWWGADGGFVSATTMPPCLDRPADQCPTYPAAAPFRHAIEVFAAGAVAAELDGDPVGLAPGTTLTVGAACTPRPR